MTPASQTDTVKSCIHYYTAQLSITMQTCCKDPWHQHHKQTLSRLVYITILHTYLEMCSDN